VTSARASGAPQSRLPEQISLIPPNVDDVVVVEACSPNALSLGSTSWGAVRRCWPHRRRGEAPTAGARCLACIVVSAVSVSRDTVAVRAIAAVLVGDIVGALVDVFGGRPYALAAAWIAAAAVYLVWTWAVVLPLDSERTKMHATREDPTHIVTDIFVVIANLASLGGVGFLLYAGSKDGREAIAPAVVGVVSVSAAWIAVHTREGMRAANSMDETAPAMRDPRRFGQLPNLAVPDIVEDPLPDTEIDAWEGNSPS
jgi:uncharacterized membrane protein